MWLFFLKHPSAFSSSVLSMVGLFLIALGTGGIKPCVAAFGGDQFDDHQVRRFHVLSSHLKFLVFDLWLQVTYHKNINPGVKCFRACDTSLLSHGLLSATELRSQQFSCRFSDCGTLLNIYRPLFPHNTCLRSKADCWMDFSKIKRKKLPSQIDLWQCVRDSLSHCCCSNDNINTNCSISR